MTDTRASIEARKEAVVDVRQVTGNIVGGGIVVGLIAGLVMAMVAMIAGATYLNRGFFTPLYMVAAPFTGSEPVQQANQAAQAGDLFAFFAGPAVVGMAIHMMWSAVWGVIFGFLARALRARGMFAVGLGIVYGLAVMIVMSFVTLPVTQAVLGGAPVVAEIPQRVGWATWTLVHVLFGMVLGLWPAVRPQSLGYVERTVRLP